jgi:predicted DNA-binding transcriptional regulator AlpA
MTAAKPLSQTLLTSTQRGARTREGVESERVQLLTADELAARWQISTHSVYRLARTAAIPCVTLGRYRRFRVASIEAWEAAQEGSSDG